MRIQSDCKKFSAVLTPYRSLNRRDFRILMYVIAAVSICAGAYFVSLGAWPVFGFFGLDVLALYWAFRWSFRKARLSEYIDMTEKTLHICRITPSGSTMNWKFNPYWVRIETEHDEIGCTRLALTSHGKTLVIGAFLGREARTSFANALQLALAAHRA